MTNGTQTKSESTSTAPVLQFSQGKLTKLILNNSAKLGSVSSAINIMPTICACSKYFSVNVGIESVNDPHHNSSSSLALHCNTFSSDANKAYISIPTIATTVAVNTVVLAEGHFETLTSIAEDQIITPELQPCRCNHVCFYILYCKFVR
ncbi:hypothetical protein F2P81_008912 [Scophthalmus maximus]|uniref:Uncharacterized protein n=1 Tax=Scophthalmus maximus TaxID=52904 RepID=A0A6A4T273_SCOMX|nr:hypothetical protein F2P81_008912 [Scophthalmus maximus]